MIQLCDMNFNPSLDYRTLDYDSDESKVMECLHSLPWADTKENQKKGLNPDMKFSIGQPIPEPTVEVLGPTSLSFEEIKNEINSNTSYPIEWYPTEESEQEYFNRLKGLNVVMIKR